MGWIGKFPPIRKLLTELEGQLGSKHYCLASEYVQSLEVRTLLVVKDFFSRSRSLNVMNHVIAAKNE